MSDVNFKATQSVNADEALQLQFLTELAYCDQATVYANFGQTLILNDDGSTITADELFFKEHPEARHMADSAADYFYSLCPTGKPEPVIPVSREFPKVAEKKPDLIDHIYSFFSNLIK